MKTLKDHIKAQGRTISWVAKQIGMSQPLLSMQLNGSATLQDSTIDSVCETIGIHKSTVKRD